MVLMEDQESLFQPLIHRKPVADEPSCYDSTSDAGILIRFLSVILVGILSLWANHEASKGFEVTVSNDVARDSPAAQRFNLFYVSNDKATRIILEASYFVEHLLYPDDDIPKKEVDRVVLRLCSLSFTTDMGAAVVKSSSNSNSYVINVSPSVMEEANADYALVSAIRRGMARVWLWEGGNSSAPPQLVAGLMEYVRMAAEGYGGLKSDAVVGGNDPPENIWWEDKDPTVVAKLLYYYERCSKGFIQRLNRGMKDKWHDRTVDDALGMPLQNLCGGYNSSRYPSS